MKNLTIKRVKSNFEESHRVINNQINSKLEEVMRNNWFTNKFRKIIGVINDRWIQVKNI